MMHTSVKHENNFNEEETYFKSLKWYFAMKKQYDVEELAVSGYMRKMEKSILQNNIPIPIHQICYRFYRSYLRLGIAYGYTRTTHYGIMNVHSKYITDYNPSTDEESKSNRFHYMSSRMHCWIPNISDALINLPDLYKHPKSHIYSYDGIFGKWIDETSYDDYDHPYFILLPPHIQQTYNYKILKSNWSIAPTSAKFCFALYCKERNSIYSEHNGALYELQLAKIKDLNFKFSLIERANDGWEHNPHNYLTMEYLVNTDSLFGISCGGRPCINYGNQYRKCGIYSFKNKKWTFVKSYEYIPTQRYTYFECATCFDGNSNTVYLQDSVGNTGQYDCIKDKWKNIACTQQVLSSRLGVLWIDTNNSNCLVWANSNEPKEITIKKMDVRSNNRKWVNMYEPIDVDYPVKLFH
eukprot:227449_1